MSQSYKKYFYFTCFLPKLSFPLLNVTPLKNRIFFVGWAGGSYVLLHHFMKKTQKTPKREIEKAKRELADLSSVPVRTIQQYEQRQKNINKAQAEYLVALAKVLYCEVEDLMEKIE